MTSPELVEFIATMFADYMRDMMPLIGFLAGTHIVINLIYDFTFRMFHRV